MGNKTKADLLRENEQLTKELAKARRELKAAERKLLHEKVNKETLQSLANEAHSRYVEEIRRDHDAEMSAAIDCRNAQIETARSEEMALTDEYREKYQTASELVAAERREREAANAWLTAIRQVIASTLTTRFDIDVGDYSTPWGTKPATVRILQHLFRLSQAGTHEVRTLPEFRKGAVVQ